jgi:hypothetical protein
MLLPTSSSQKPGTVKLVVALPIGTCIDCLKDQSGKARRGGGEGHSPTYVGVRTWQVDPQTCRFIFRRVSSMLHLPSLASLQGFLHSQATEHTLVVAAGQISAFWILIASLVQGIIGGATLTMLVVTAIMGDRGLAFAWYEIILLLAFTTACTLMFKSRLEQDCRAQIHEMIGMLQEALDVRFEN